MAGRLADRIALITGGARGQGEAEARLFAAEGAQVVIADILDERGEDVARDIGDAATYRHLDVAEEADWDATISHIAQQFRRLDVVVNNAGIYNRRTIEDLTLDEYMRVIRINQVGCWLGMKKTLPLLREAGSGSIINVSSTAGYEGAVGGSAYGGSKWAVRGMTKSAALEFAPYGIRVNSVHPGAVATELFTTVDDMRERLKTLVPLGRVGEVEDLARLVLFLASDDSSYCTGSEFLIDGGLLSGRSGGSRPPGT